MDNMGNVSSQVQANPTQNTAEPSDSEDSLVGTVLYQGTAETSKNSFAKLYQRKSTVKDPAPTLGEEFADKSAESTLGEDETETRSMTGSEFQEMIKQSQSSGESYNSSKLHTELEEAVGSSPTQNRNVPIRQGLAMNNTSILRSSMARKQDRASRRKSSSMEADRNTISEQQLHATSEDNQPSLDRNTVTDSRASSPMERKMNLVLSEDGLSSTPRRKHRRKDRHPTPQTEATTVSSSNPAKTPKAMKPLSFSAKLNLENAKVLARQSSSRSTSSMPVRNGTVENSISTEPSRSLPPLEVGNNKEKKKKRKSKGTSNDLTHDASINTPAVMQEPAPVEPAIPEKQATIPSDPLPQPQLDTPKTMRKKKDRPREAGNGVETEIVAPAQAVPLLDLEAEDKERKKEERRIRKEEKRKAKNDSANPTEDAAADIMLPIPESPVLETVAPAEQRHELIDPAPQAQAERREKRKRRKTNDVPGDDPSDVNMATIMAEPHSLGFETREEQELDSVDPVRQPQVEKKDKKKRRKTRDISGDVADNPAEVEEVPPVIPVEEPSPLDLKAKEKRQRKEEKRQKKEEKRQRKEEHQQRKKQRREERRKEKGKQPEIYHNSSSPAPIAHVEDLYEEDDTPTTARPSLKEWLPKTPKSAESQRQLKSKRKEKSAVKDSVSPAPRASGSKPSGQYSHFFLSDTF